MVSEAEQIEIRQRVKKILARRRMYQFGQPHSSLTGMGMYACMDTSIQLTARITQGKTYTLNQIRRATGAPRFAGTPAANAAVGLRRLGLPYVIKCDIGVAELIDIIKNRGPVIIAYRYWAHPHWKGATYGTHRMTGITTNNAGQRVNVGFSNPLGKSGANQWGFRGGHASLLAWARTDGGVRIGVRDPNHDSAMRPQRPAWDKIDRGQLVEMLNSIKPANAGRSLVFIPTRRVVSA